MQAGIGLPTTIPGAQPHDVLEFARRAEAAGFSTLGTIDRLVYANYEPLVAFGAVAAVTERINLMQKLDAHTRIEAIRVAEERGWL